MTGIGRVCVAAGLALVSASAGFAATPTEPEGPALVEKPANSADGSPVSIDVAKKDFESVKSLRQFGAEGKESTPSLSLPRWQGESSAPPMPLSKTKTDSEMGARGSNWLVDAMEKRPPAHRERDSFQDRRTVDEVRDRRSDTRSRETTVDGREREEKANPFSQYLGQWMTAQDYALLKPGLERTALREVTDTAGTPLRPVEENWLNGLAGKTDTTTQMLLPSPVPRTKGDPVVNPYLAMVGGGVSHANAGVATPPKPVAPVLAPSSPPALAPGADFALPTPKSKLPEFVRPNDDEKYFKQLKRF